MTSPHRIRLQGRWQVIPPGQKQEELPDERPLPQSWRSLFGEKNGTAIFRRAFHTPTNLTDRETVLIRVPEQAGQIRCCLLNGAVVLPVPDCPRAFDVSTRLSSGLNQLELQIFFNPAEVAEDVGGIWQPVVLEIFSAPFIPVP